jgi:hypothetical protein
MLKVSRPGMIGLQQALNRQPPTRLTPDTSACCGKRELTEGCNAEKEPDGNQRCPDLHCSASVIFV